MLTVIGLDRKLVIRTGDPEFAKKKFRPYAIIFYLVGNINIFGRGWGRALKNSNYISHQSY